MASYDRMPPPHLLVILDLEADVALQRITDRGPVVMQSSRPLQDRRIDFRRLSQPTQEVQSSEIKGVGILSDRQALLHPLGSLL